MPDFTIAYRQNESGLVNIIIDTPKGSRNKYKYDEAAMLPPESHPPPGPLSVRFGSIPNTLLKTAIRWTSF
jgi:inorganic pyrophosphatase